MIVKITKKEAIDLGIIFELIELMGFDEYAFKERSPDDYVFEITLDQYNSIK